MPAAIQTYGPRDVDVALLAPQGVPANRARSPKAGGTGVCGAGATVKDQIIDAFAQIFVELDGGSASVPRSIQTALIGATIVSVTGVTYVTTTVTVTTGSAHGLAVGDSVGINGVQTSGTLASLTNGSRTVTGTPTTTTYTFTASSTPTGTYTANGFTFAPGKKGAAIAPVAGDTYKPLLGSGVYGGDTALTGSKAFVNTICDERGNPVLELSYPASPLVSDNRVEMRSAIAGARRVRHITKGTDLSIDYAFECKGYGRVTTKAEPENSSAGSERPIRRSGAVRRWMVDPGVSTPTFSAQGMVAPTLTGGTSTANTADDGFFAQWATAAAANDFVGFATAFNVLRVRWDPETISKMRTGAANSSTNCRVWHGWFSADPALIYNPTGIAVAAFRFDYVQDYQANGNDSAIVCVTSDGAGNVQSTRLDGTNGNPRVDFANATTFVLGIRAIKEGSTRIIEFAINDTRVVSHSTHIPGDSTNLGIAHRHLTIDGVAGRSTRFAWLEWSMLT